MFSLNLNKVLQMSAQNTRIRKGRFLCKTCDLIILALGHHGTELVIQAEPKKMGSSEF